MQYTITKVDEVSQDTCYSGSVSDIENALFFLTAHLTGLEIDKQLVKHTLPLYVCDAVCCRITGEQPSPAPGMRVFGLSVTSRAGSISSNIFDKVKNFFAGAGTPLFLQISSECISTPVTVGAIVFDNVWKYSSVNFGGVKVPTLSGETSVCIYA